MLKCQNCGTEINWMNFKEEDEDPEMLKLLLSSFSCPKCGKKQIVQENTK
tara:strand:+ start:231 stop:380 length:150 start_codon:yes stop_codon:yes gene_type:complete